MKKNSSRTASRTRGTQQKVLEYLTESGNVSYSCKRVGISRETFYKWKENRVFAFNAEAAIEYGKSFVNDLAHTQLIFNIQKGDMQAVRFHLASCHPDYQPKRPRILDDEISIPVATIEIIPARHKKSLAEEKLRPVTPPPKTEDGEA